MAIGPEYFLSVRISIENQKKKLQEKVELLNKIKVELLNKIIEEIDAALSKSQKELLNKILDCTDPTELDTIDPNTIQIEVKMEISDLTLLGEDLRSAYLAAGWKRINWALWRENSMGFTFEK